MSMFLDRPEYLQEYISARGYNVKIETVPGHQQRRGDPPTYRIICDVRPCNSMLAQIDVVKGGCRIEWIMPDGPVDRRAEANCMRHEYERIVDHVRTVEPLVQWLRAHRNICDKPRYEASDTEPGLKLRCSFCASETTVAWEDTFNIRDVVAAEGTRPILLKCLRLMTAGI